MPYGTGCLADQLLGRYLAHVTGLGYVLDPGHVKRTMRSILRNNFKGPLASFNNVPRTYALNDEAGLVLCTWPKGDRAALPFPYCDEVWTGFEYQVAASLIYNGLVDEGLKFVKAARDRYNGLHRNPWDEEECGHHYARAMSSWALLLALSGSHYDGVQGEMVFARVHQEKSFTSFWSCGSGWGTVRFEKFRGKHVVTLQPIYGAVALCSQGFPGLHSARGGVTAVVDGKPVKAKPDAGNHGGLRFGDKRELRKNSTLKVTF
jgi:non-lysosomal glucosylceramidase